MERPLQRPQAVEEEYARYNQVKEDTSRASGTIRKYADLD